MEEYPLYPPGVRPDSICSASAAYEHLPPRWTAEEKRRSLRDGGAMFREAQWHPAGPPPPPAYYGHVDPLHGSMRRLSIQPRSRSVPRSPSSSVSGGPYSPGPHLYASPLRSPSVHFDRGGPGRLRDDMIYADPSAYGLRRSLSSPKVRRPLCLSRVTVCISLSHITHIRHPLEFEEDTKAARLILSYCSLIEM